MTIHIKEPTDFWLSSQYFLIFFRPNWNETTVTTMTNSVDNYNYGSRRSLYTYNDQILVGKRGRSYWPNGPNIPGHTLNTDQRTVGNLVGVSHTTVTAWRSLTSVGFALASSTCLDTCLWDPPDVAKGHHQWVPSTSCGPVYVASDFRQSKSIATRKVYSDSDKYDRLWTVGILL